MCSTISNDRTSRFIIDYCIANNIRYQLKESLLVVFFKGNYSIVYFPIAKAFFAAKMSKDSESKFCGEKIMENPCLDQVEDLLNSVC